MEHLTMDAARKMMSKMNDWEIMFLIQSISGSHRLIQEGAAPEEVKAILSQKLEKVLHCVTGFGGDVNEFNSNLSHVLSSMAEQPPSVFFDSKKKVYLFEGFKHDDMHELLVHGFLSLCPCVQWPDLLEKCKLVLNDIKSLSGEEMSQEDIDVLHQKIDSRTSTNLEARMLLGMLDSNNLIEHEHHFEMMHLTSRGELFLELLNSITIENLE